MVTSNRARPGFHPPGTAWRWHSGKSRLWGFHLGEQCPVQCQRLWHPTLRRLVVQDRGP